MLPKQLLLIAFFFLASAVAYSQDADLQKLMASPDDTIKVTKLSALAKGLLSKDRKQARELAVAVIDLSKKLKYNEGIGNGYSVLAVADFSDGKQRAAIPNFMASADYYRKAKNDMGEAKSLGNLAGAYIAIGNTDSSIYYRLTAIALLEKNKESASCQTRHTLSMQYHNLATNYQNLLKQTDKSIAYYRKAESIARPCNDTFMLVNTLGAITETIANTDAKQAFIAAEEALRLAKPTNNDALLAHGYQSYAIALIASNRVDEAITPALQAIEFADRAQDFIRYISASITYSQALEKKKDYRSQITVLEKLLQKVSENEQVQFLSDIYRPLAEAQYKVGNYKAAYDYSAKNTLFKDSIVKLENNRIMADMEFRYQTAQKEKELSGKQLKIAQKDLELQKSQQYILYSIGAAVLALLLATIIYIVFKNKRKQHQRQLKTMQQEKELQLLQALMQGEEKERSRIAKDLHDGVAGMLAAIKMHLSTGDENAANNNATTQAILLLDEATMEVRKTSHNLMPEVLLRHGLNEAIRRYCSNISNATLEVKYYFVGDDQRYVESFELSVYRIVQELLNNVFKHSKATETIVQMSIQPSQLSISIEDNGIGISKELLKSGGMGLGSLRYRIGALNGNLELQTESGMGVNAYLEFATDRLERRSQSSFTETIFTPAGSN